MIGNEKLSTIREKLRVAFAREDANPIASLDRRIRELKIASPTAQAELRSLHLLRKALARIIEEKPKKTGQARRNRAKKAM
jgi:hypothetical protein